MRKTVFLGMLAVSSLSSGWALGQQTTPASAPAAAPPASLALASGNQTSEVDGMQIAPGFTSAPAVRITTDYRGRPVARYVKRRVADNWGTPAPTPAPAPEAAPVTTSANAKATQALGGKSADTPPPSPQAKKAPAAKKPAAPAPKKKKTSNAGWDTGGW